MRTDRKLRLVLRPVGLIFFLAFGLFVHSGCSSLNGRKESASAQTQEAGSALTLGLVIHENTQDQKSRTAEDLFRDFERCKNLCPDQDKAHADSFEQFFRLMTRLMEVNKTPPSTAVAAAARRSIFEDLSRLVPRIEAASAHLLANHFERGLYQRSIAEFAPTLNPIRYFRRPPGATFTEQINQSALKLIAEGKPTADLWYVAAITMDEPDTDLLTQIRPWFECLKLSGNDSACRQGYERASARYREPICDLDAPPLKDLKLVCEVKRKNEPGSFEAKYQGQPIQFQGTPALTRVGILELQMSRPPDRPKALLISLGLRPESRKSWETLVKSCVNHRLGLTLAGEAITIPTVSEDAVQSLLTSNRVELTVPPEEANAFQQARYENLLCTRRSREVPAQLRF
jgi:hypothetical protein